MVDRPKRGHWRCRCGVDNRLQDKFCEACGLERVLPSADRPAEPPRHYHEASAETGWRCVCGGQLLPPERRHKAVQTLQAVLDGMLTPRAANQQIDELFRV